MTHTRLILGLSSYFGSDDKGEKKIPKGMMTSQWETELLGHSTMDIWGEMILHHTGLFHASWGAEEHLWPLPTRCQFSSASSIPQLSQPKASADGARCLQGWGGVCWVKSESSGVLMYKRVSLGDSYWATSTSGPPGTTILHHAWNSQSGKEILLHIFESRPLAW